MRKTLHSKLLMASAEPSNESESSVESTWYKISKIYVWDNLVRPTEITQTFRVSDWLVSLYKAGYKIKEVTIQYTTYTSSSWWLSTSWWIRMYNWSSQVWPDYRAIFRLKSEWHYSSYVDAGYWMVGWWKKDDGTSGDTQIKRFASSATNSSGGSCILTFNENGGRIRVGTTFWTRIQDETYTHDSAKKTRTQTIFNSQYVTISNYWDGTISNDLMTVTRESAN